MPHHGFSKHRCQTRMNTWSCRHTIHIYVWYVGIQTDCLDRPAKELEHINKTAVQQKEKIEEMKLIQGAGTVEVSSYIETTTNKPGPTHWMPLTEELLTVLVIYTNNRIAFGWKLSQCFQTSYSPLCLLLGCSTYANPLIIAWVGHTQRQLTHRVTLFSM